MKNDKKILLGVAVIIMVVILTQGIEKKETGDFVQFRTPDFGISNIAYSPICGNELVGYGYVGPSSYDCVSSDIIATLSDYEICTRPGYTDRLYLMEGTNGRYYNTAEYTEDSLSLSPLPVTPEFEVTCTGTEPCVSILWAPDPSTVCDGETFIQNSDCGTTRQAIGTMECGVDIICNVNSDCGTNGFIGDNYCSEGIVVKDYNVYYCRLPGTSSSYCESEAEARVIQDCGTNGCTDGECGDGLVVFICNTRADEECDGCVSDVDFPAAVYNWKNQLRGIIDAEFPEMVVMWETQEGC